MSTEKMMLNELKQIHKQLKDQETGFQNQPVQIEDTELEYISTATQLKIQEDQEKLKKYQVLLKETYDYFSNQSRPLNQLQLIRQLCADVEFIFTDRKAGQQKKLLVYKSFLQFLKQVDNNQYNTLQKANILDMIEEEYQHNKKDLMTICKQLHKGLNIGIKVFQMTGCM